MNRVASVAKNRSIRLQQELVALLCQKGSIEGAEQFWRRVDFANGFGRQLARYGFDKSDSQLLTNKVAFPDLNFNEVDAALKAGNKLKQLHALASGRALIARNANGRYKSAGKGLKIIRLRRSAAI